METESNFPIPPAQLPQASLTVFEKPPDRGLERLPYNGLKRTIILYKTEPAIIDTLRSIAADMDRPGFNDVGEIDTFITNGQKVTRNGEKYGIVDLYLPEETAQYFNFLLDPAPEQREAQDLEIAELRAKIQSARSAETGRKVIRRNLGNLQTLAAMRQAARSCVVWLVSNRASLQNIVENRAKQGWVWVKP